MIRWRIRPEWLPPLLLALAVGLLAFKACAHEGNDQLSAWYSSLQTPFGMSCCNMRDCKTTDARIEHEHWRAKVGDQWIDVPDSAVLHRDNLAGEAVICMWNGSVRCFVPPSET